MSLARAEILDSPERAEAARAALDLPRHLCADLGNSAVGYAADGRYPGPDGRMVEWGDAVRRAIVSKISVPPGEPLPEPAGTVFAETGLRIANQTTLVAARALYEEGLRPLALNFANGVQPGGGFFQGARAQEETLCRSSALYLTLEGDDMYARHRERPRPDSTDWAILSPDVPVFRTDDGTPLAEPWLLSFLTCAAPYVPGVGQPESGDLLAARIRRVLGIARAHGYESLVLGAWGCGAFHNDPARTARDFRGALSGPYRGAFRQVTFAITDWSPDRWILGTFVAEFGVQGMP